MRTEEIDREIEIGIIRTFGWAIIEFEAVLYQKFLVMSAASSLMTEDRFRKYLKKMEAKGYISPVDFQGKRAWKRLVIESDIDEETLTPDEVRAYIEQAKANETKKQSPIKHSSDNIVSESKALAEEILHYLDMGMPSRIRVKPQIGEPTLIDHVEAMRHSLAKSREDFLKYVKKNLPRVHEDLEKLLKQKGEEVLLRSLRVIESGQRTYPPQ